MQVDVVALSGMAMTVLIMVIIAAIILLYPLTRRLGELLEQRIQEKKEGASPDPATATELAELRRVVRSLEQEVSTLAERQRFVEGLLDSPERNRTLAGGSEG